MNRKLLAALISVITVFPVTACGKSKPLATAPAAATTIPIPEGTQLSVKEATLLSRLLFINRDKGGANFHIDVPYGLRSTVKIDGIIDWKTHTGTGTVQVIGTDGGIVDTSTVYWRDLYDTKNGLVATTLNGLPEAMDAIGRKGVKYVARPLSLQSPLDRVLRYLDGLATDQAENPLLLRQNPKAKSLGVEEVTFGKILVPASVLRYGKSRYWADPKTGQMVQAAAPLAGLSQDTMFFFASHEPKSVTLPVASEVVDQSEIPEIYTKLSKHK
jgi:predicted small lipoprotein YifL